MRFKRSINEKAVTLSGRRVVVSGLYQLALMDQFSMHDPTKPEGDISMQAAFRCRLLTQI